MFNIHQHRRKVVVLALGLAAALTLSACFSSDDDASKNHNAQDVTFAKDMIPHHGQAVEMAKLADSRAQTPRVKALADQIEGAQQPEIDQMNGWLKAWGESTVDPSAPADEHAGHGSSMPGMMSAADMTKLSSASGTAFDRMFLQMMIDHHKGAIEMSKTETDKGKDTQAKALAESIATSQQAEITEMEKLLTEIR